MTICLYLFLNVATTVRPPYVNLSPSLRALSAHPPGHYALDSLSGHLLAVCTSISSTFQSGQRRALIRLLLHGIATAALIHLHSLIPLIAPFPVLTLLGSLAGP